MKIENTEVYGFDGAIRGMRNPLDSWNKSDSEIKWGEIITDNPKNNNAESFVLGENDKSLAQKLTKAGSEHCKFLRQIQVWVDLTLPRYIWSEFDTYKFNTKNSCSTMHTAHKRELTQSDFEGFVLPSTIGYLNELIGLYKNKKIARDLFIHRFKCNLPEGFLQKRTVNTNYAELLNMYNQRKSHRLEEWHKICNWILRLPFFAELTGLEERKEV